MPEAKPPMAPASALKRESEASTAHRSRYVSCRWAGTSSGMAVVEDGDRESTADPIVDAVAATATVVGGTNGGSTVGAGAERDNGGGRCGSATPYSAGDVGAAWLWAERGCWL